MVSFIGVSLVQGFTMSFVTSHCRQWQCHQTCHHKQLWVLSGKCVSMPILWITLILTPLVQPLTEHIQPIQLSAHLSSLDTDMITATLTGGSRTTTLQLMNQQRTEAELIILMSSNKLSIFLTVIIEERAWIAVQVCARVSDNWLQHKAVGVVCNCGRECPEEGTCLVHKAIRSLIVFTL
jgi:hypothetical protein